MIDLEETKISIEQLSAYLNRHRGQIEDPIKLRDFMSDFIETLLVITSRLFAHISELESRGSKVNAETIILPQRMRSDNELHINGKRNVDV